MGSVKNLRILIATPLYPPDIGGPAIYAKNLSEEFFKAGHEVKIVKYNIERYLPTGIRHFLYLLRIVFSISGQDLIIALDTFSVGLPAVIASVFLKKKIIIRVGGDFLWESYANRTQSPIPLKEFNERTFKLSVKERSIYFLTRFVLKNASAVAFNTSWQKDIFRKSYDLLGEHFFTVENYYGPKRDSAEALRRVYLWAGRDIFIKNLETLRRAFGKAKEENFDIELNLITGITHEELLDKMRSCYAILLPSLSDVAPNFIIDAISMNKPFIMTRETGLFDKLKNIGIFINPSKEDELKDRILYLAEQKNYDEYKRRISEFSFVHSWKDMADEFLDIYEKSRTK